MRDTLRPLVERALAAVEAKDVDAVLACLSDDAVVIDPHYPKTTMRGKGEIADGLRWVFATMRQLGLPIVSYFEAADGTKAAVEVATSHVLAAGGMKLAFSQVFVVEARDGRITRLRAYTPYGPPGIGGMFLALTRVQRRMGW